ncbi:hypothetical protein FQR65_LT13389 [Abscondita terminalis]|nr:hypothetical protein FQR65_LT13389 [Abscondita terminalis]
MKHLSESTESNAEEDQFEIRRKPTKRKAKSPIPTSSLSQTTPASPSMRTDQLLDVVVNIEESTESNAEEDQSEIRRKPTKRKAKSPIPTSSLSQTTPASPSMRTDQLLDVVVNIEGISTRRESTYKTSIERQTDLFNGGASANQTKKLSDNNTNNRINLEAPDFHPDMDLNYNTTSTTTEELVSIPESTESNAVGGQSEIRRKPTKRKAKPPIPTSSLSQTTSASSSMRTDQLLDVVVNNKETESNEVEGQFKVPRNPAQRKGKKRVPASSDLHQPSETIHTSSSMETDQLLDTVIHYEGTPFIQFFCL